MDFPCNEEEMYKNKVFHSWYQWVPFYYIAVAVAYYIPYLILKTTSKLFLMSNFVCHRDFRCHIGFLSQFL